MVATEHDRGEQKVPPISEVNMSIGTEVPTTSGADDVVPASSPGRRRPALAPGALAMGAVLAAVGLGVHQGAIGGFEAESLAQTRAIAARPGLWLAAHLLSSLGMILVAGGMVSVAQVARDQEARAARIGAVIASVGATFMSLGDIAHGSVGFALAGQVNAADSLVIEKAFFSNPAIGTVLGLGMLLPLGILVLGVGLIRSRLVPRWAGIVVLASPIVIQAGLAGAIPPYLFALPFVIGMWVLAWTVRAETALPTARSNN